MSLPKRFPREILDAQEMRKSGIYYLHDEMNTRLGHAMVIGPEDTPYAHCPLIFRFEFPSDYPFTSPTVTFVTSDGITRFHPNLYVSGKVCLSILGTWSGPKWSAVMTISTVLASIQSLLEPNPIVNEPGWETLTLKDQRASDYAGLLQARLISHCFRSLCRWKKGVKVPEWELFEDVLAERGDELIAGLTSIIMAKEEKTYTNVVYNMNGTTEWGELVKCCADLITPKE
jgi:ubiquitin-protein ligase